MEPIDRRITAPTLLSLLDQPKASEEIANVLGVRQMNEGDALRTREAIDAFVRSRDATAAAQLIHAAGVRKQSRTPRQGGLSGQADLS